MTDIKIRGFDENVTVPVTVELQNEALKLRVTYKRLDKPQMQAIVEEATARANEARDLQTKKLHTTDEDKLVEIDDRIKELDQEGIELIRDRLVDWKGLKGTDDKKIPFDKDTLDVLLDHPAYLSAFDSGMWLATGAAVKN